MAQNDSERVYNFSAGPATLPLPALKEAQRDLVAMAGTGMSVMEMSHRSKTFTGIIEEAESNIRNLLGLPERYHVLFLQGGATFQFSMVPINFLRDAKGGADYILTGSWAGKAVKEAQKEGEVHVAWDGKSDQYTRMPKPTELDLRSEAAYVHMTSNETIQGIEFSDEPDTGDVPLVCDASSDFLSRPLPIERYALLYAGAQKNVGPAGVTVVIIREDLVDRVPENQHALLDYRLLAEKKSLYNTPPCFGIYMVMLVTRWLRDEIGGLERMAEINRRKARALYDAIDGSNGFYRGHAAPDSRSWMNVTWRMEDESLEQKFLEQAEARRLAGLKGHRSVGGLRASIYNAMGENGVQALCDFMKEFQEAHAG